MAYLLNKPQATDLLSESQPVIRDNFNTADTVFGIDHYSFANGTANKGYHDKVTTPLIVGSSHPSTAAECKFYAMQDTSQIGVIQYSRGPNDSIPSPVTELHSGTVAISLTAGSGSTALNATGTALIIGTLYVCVRGAGPQGLFTADFYWNSTFPGYQIINRSTQTSLGPAGITVIENGALLRIKNQSTSTINEIFWTLRLHRIDV